MPSKSEKQRRTMAACSHGAKLAVCERIPMKVAQEFHEADKRRSDEKHGYFKMTKERS